MRDLIEQMKSRSGFLSFWFITSMMAIPLCSEWSALGECLLVLNIFICSIWLGGVTILFTATVITILGRLENKDEISMRSWCCKLCLVTIFGVSAGFALQHFINVVLVVDVLYAAIALVALCVCASGKCFTKATAAS